MQPYLLGLILVALVVVAVSPIGTKVNQLSGQVAQLRELFHADGPIHQIDRKVEAARVAATAAGLAAADAMLEATSARRAAEALDPWMVAVTKDLATITGRLDTLENRPAFPDLISLADSARQVYDNALFNLRCVEALVEASARPDDAPTAARAHRDAALARLETGQAGVVEAFLSAPSPMAEPGPAH